MKKNLRKVIKYSAILLYRIMCLFPLSRNKIVFDSSLGKSYTGNPRYIFEYLNKHGHLKWKCIWFYEKSPHITLPAKQVRYGRFRYLYHMATAKIWVFDCRQPEFLIHRKGVAYIQTWHGTPLKKLALDMDEVFMLGENNIDAYKKSFKENVQKWDYLISQNPFASRTFRRAFSFEKEMLEIGYPRNDILFRENTSDDIKRRKNLLGIPLDKKVLLYAPTWRDDEYQFSSTLSYQLMMEQLGNEYIILVKCHYLVMDCMDWSPYETFIYPSSQNQDIAELFIVADMLITDYSSVMFDYSILHRPIFFYAYDMNNYEEKLRGFYFDYKEEMPGPISKTTEELIHDIKNYDANVYEEKYKKFQKKYNTFDDGNASKQVVELIESLV